MNNKWTRAAIPALLIHCSIGTVYCWSTFKEAIAEKIGMSTFSVGWAFSIAIFFLGMSAAFGGRVVEKDIYYSSNLAWIFFSTGMIGTGLVVRYLSGIPALLGIYLFYGCVMGTGLGIGYLTPVKTLMLWFKDQKGLATGISIMGFGLAKAIATPLMEWLQIRVGIDFMFIILGGVYAVLMFMGHLLLKKPSGWTEDIPRTDNSLLKSLIRDSRFRNIWLMFYLNIHCGLMLITYEKQILKTTFAGTSGLALILSVVPSITAICNAVGRLGYSTLSDKMKDRMIVYKFIFWLSLWFSGCTALMYKVTGHTGFWVLMLLVITNLGYGGGFSTLPALLSSRFGMKNVSQIHGFTLTAWAIAGLTGNNLSELLLSHGYDFSVIYKVMALLYLVAFVCTILENKDNEKRIKDETD